ncbi:extracellular catalytic domain type 1 short-chain-length polyhydroxyalkanoate depolymerase [Roseococcus microcysteis]|uniref:extracellular catalytic domain type 1 short-chain-length polyhydroxyalkanoate depolymerase n=1 Tax=Roseococcus microcysteis TaxID=2771361 RepID=UPI001CC3E273|nr:PHB depolymerase family esterase [Roseococcus microcysteis]
MRLIRFRRPPGAAAALRRMSRATMGATMGLMRAAWAPTPPTMPTPGRTSAITGFGTNPGGLRMFVHVPRRAPAPGTPLIVVLHGCGQDAASFAADAGWIAMSEALGVPLLLPEQVRENNRHRCFNWFRPQDVARGQGEAMSIRQGLRWAMRHFGTDKRRVFVVGLSAGGAMAAALLAAYPAVFAAGAVVAGMPVGSAVTPGGALLRMRHANRFTTRAGLAASVRAFNPARGTARWPRLSIWQGGRDRTVHPDNAALLATQWGALHGLLEEPSQDTEPAPGARLRQWSRGATALVELWTLEEMAHGFPIGEGEGRAARWVLAAGTPAARRICDFWGLSPAADSRPR